MENLDKTNEKITEKNVKTLDNSVNELHSKLEKADILGKECLFAVSLIGYKDGDKANIALSDITTPYGIYQLLAYNLLETLEISMFERFLNQSESVLENLDESKKKEEIKNFESMLSAICKTNPRIKYYFSKSKKAKK